MYGDNLVVGSYVIIKNGCPLTVSVDSPDQAQITCGVVRRDAFEFVIEREALRTFVELGSDALKNMDEAKQ